MFNGPYIDWNQKRIKAIVEYYGHQFFFQKKVLDLGCGHGDISGVLHRLGAEVTAVDARQEHLKIVAKKYNGVKVVKADLDQPWPFLGKTFDLTLDLALLCHLNGFEEHLKAICASSNYLILETAVLDSNDPHACVIKPDNKNIYDGSFNGFSCQVSAANIERVLTQCGMKFQRMDQTKFNSAPYSYDWHNRNDNSFDINKRRIWFCIKQGNHTPITSNNQPANILPAVHGGTFSPHLTDSKMPLSHQKLIATASPAPPRTHIPPVAVFAASLYAPQNTNKIRLFYNYYEDKDTHRKAEIDFCLRKNIDNPLFDLIVIESDTIPTFDFMFDKVNRLAGPNDISIICNTYIFFNNTISLAQLINDKEAYVLNRWDWSSDNNTRLFDNDIGQYAWIIKGKVENVAGHFQIDRPGSDGRIAYELQKAGYKVINPSRSIKACQSHNSRMVSYTENDRVRGDYLYVPVVGL